MPRRRGHSLSVSSNGSTWVKLNLPAGRMTPPTFSFSILERIDVGETITYQTLDNHEVPFSILERIDVGETSR